MADVALFLALAIECGIPGHYGQPALDSVEMGRSLRHPYFTKHQLNNVLRIEMIPRDPQSNDITPLLIT